MIVEPDFLDHWKTRMLIDILGDRAAPLLVIRLWAHCQQRKEWRFQGMTAEILRAVCRYDGDGQTLWNALAEAGFIDVFDGVVAVHDFEVANAALVQRWRAGSLGGRPSKTTKNIGKKTGAKPGRNRSVTGGKPGRTGPSRDRSLSKERERECVAPSLGEGNAPLSKDSPGTTDPREMLRYQ